MHMCAFVCVCVCRLTIIISPHVQQAGVVVGRAGAGCRGNGEEVGIVLPQFGKQEDVIVGCFGDGIVDSGGSGGVGVRVRGVQRFRGLGVSCFLQGEQVEGASVGFHRGVPAYYDGCRTEDLSTEIVDRITGHCGERGGINITD